MATHPFRLVNVFTREQGPFTGNPLCVFENGAGLSTEEMQALARQFNLSETTFILPSTRANARVRIFTPAYEMAFAGHPTLGTAHVCRALKLGSDSLVLEMQAGLIPVRAGGDRWTLSALGATSRELDVSRDALAAALGLKTQDIGERPLWVKAGKEQLVVPLTSTDAVRRAVPSAAAMAKIRSEEGQSTAYVFCLSGGGGPAPAPNPPRG
jgi:trans-2,3-dihydro-3-hydroxyanthranilate isomerase